ncbi:MAG: EamA family transporter [Candidatus Dormibacteria bacterium]
MIISQVRGRVAIPAAWRAWVALLAVYFLWGSTYTGIQVGVREFPPLLLAGTRYVAAGVILYLLAGRRGGWRHLPARWQLPSRREALSAGVVGLLLLLGGNGLLTVAEVRVQSGLASLLIATVPLFMAVLSRPLKGSRPLGLSGWCGIGLGLLGLVILVGPGASGHLDFLWALVLLLAAFLWSVGSLYAQHAPLASNVLLASAVEMLVGGAALLVAGLVTGEGARVHLGGVGAPAWIALAWLILAGSLAGYTCYTYSLKAMPATTVATYAYVNPLVALGLGWLILGQGLTLGAAVAALCITLAVILMVSGPALARRRLRRRPWWRGAG